MASFQAWVWAFACLLLTRDCLCERHRCRLPQALSGFRVETAAAVIDYNMEEPSGVMSIEPTAVAMRLFGCSLDEITRVKLTPSPGNCSQVSDEVPGTDVQSFPSTTTQLHFNAKFPVYATYYFCLSNETQFIHQGTDAAVTLIVTPRTHKHYMPLPLQAIIVAFMLCLSGLFAGLTLGLMSLDATELQIVMKYGEPNEKKYAEVIYPIRKNGNYLLCTLVLGNVVVNNGLTILFDDLTTGLIALISSTIGIVIFGEIIPQSICCRWGLAVGARTVWITRFFMVLTAPAAWPLSKILDLVLGKEVGKAYTRERLLELIRLTYQSESKQDEIRILAGTLEMADKVVGQVMTHIEDIFMLRYDAVLDTETIGEVIHSGYTRIPVFEGHAPHITVVGLLNVKDMALLDPDDAVPVQTVCQFYQHPIRTVMEDMPLMMMLEEFKKGHYHLAFVQRINQEGLGDPFYELVGLVTLEDIIEEIIQSEIVDETDVVFDNRRRLPRRDTQVRDLRLLMVPGAADPVDETSHISSQLTVAAFQYLTTTVKEFHFPLISEHVLQRLIRQYVRVGQPAPDRTKPRFLYERDTPAKHFILILEGYVEVVVGEGNFNFEAGPFFAFGHQVLEQVAAAAPRLSVRAVGGPGPVGSYSFIPDFSAKITQKVTYLCISASSYLKAYRATLIEKAKGADSDKLSAILSSLNVFANQEDSNFDPNIRRVRSTLDVTEAEDRPKLLTLSTSDLQSDIRRASRDLSGKLNGRRRSAGTLESAENGGPMRKVS